MVLCTWRTRLALAMAASFSALCAAEQLVLDRAAVMERARLHAPSVLAEATRIEVAQGHAQQASLWPYNPELSIRGGPRMDNDATSWDRGFGISQRLPLSGRRSAARDQAAAGITQARASLAGHTRDVLKQAAVLHLAAIRDRQVITLVEEELQLTRRIAVVVDKRRQAGDANDLDVNVATISIARAEARHRNARAQFDARCCELLALLGITENENIAIAGDLSWPLPTDQDRFAAILRRPEMAALEADRRLALSAQAMVQARTGIDPQLALEYEREEGADIVHLGITIELPVAERAQGDRVAAMATMLMNERRIAAERLRLLAEIDASMEQARALRQSAEAFREAILPTLQANESLTDAAFKSGEITLSQVLTQQREVLAARAELLDLEHAAASAAVEATAALASPPFNTDQ